MPVACRPIENVTRLSVEDDRAIEELLIVEGVLDGAPIAKELFRPNPEPLAPCDHKHKVVRAALMESEWCFLIIPKKHSCLGVISWKTRELIQPAKKLPDAQP